MVFKPNISKYKQKLIIFLSALFISLAINPPTEVYANWADAVASFINSTYSDTTAGTSEIQNGVSISRTGYLCYMVNKESGAPTSEAKAFYAGSNWIPGSIWRVSSRHGNLSVSNFTDPAPWGQPWIPPASKGDTITSLEPNIKDWFRTNGSAFVQEYFTANHSNFVADTEVLVVETIMNVQFSTASGAEADAEACRQEANRRLSYYDTKMLCQLAQQYGNTGVVSNYLKWNAEIKKGDLTHYDDLNNMITDIHDDIRDAIADQLIANGFGTDGGRNYLGSPVIGTVPNLLAYDQWNTTVFDSYLNKGAVHAEKIVYSEAGFTAYSGSGVLSDAEVQQYGVAMILIHCKDEAQTTCNEPSIPSPHDPPIESTGKVTIVKSYRDKINGTLTDAGTYSTSDLGTQILIENEQVYQVIAWKTSTTTNTNISSISWESSVPSSVVQQGTTPKSVTLQPQETCLYVLLEKVEEEEVEEKEWNYHLTQSQITRTVWFSNPDRPLTNMNSPYIQDHQFQWTAVAHQECVKHGFWNDCHGRHRGSLF